MAAIERRVRLGSRVLTEALVSGSMELSDQMRAALGTGTAWRRLARGVPLPTVAAGLAFLPLVGTLVGVASAGVGLVGATLAPAGGVVLAAIALEAFAGRRPTLVGGVAAVVKASALWGLPESARVVPLVLAATLGRWAVVVQCYGGVPAPGADASPLVGRARFREFGLASVTAIGGALVALDALGLLAVLAAAFATVGLRTLAYRSDGLTKTRLERTETVVEAVVLAVIAGAVVAMRGS